MNKYHVELMFTEPLLGTIALDPAIYGKYIGPKHPDGVTPDDELETIEEPEMVEGQEDQRAVTGFHRQDGQPFIFDYVIKGFFKDACGMLRRVPESGSSKLIAYRKIIDGLVFVSPRRIPITLSGEMDILTRPIRINTPQGERVAIACSELVPIGSSIAFDVLIIGSISQTLLEEWFTYGALRGLGQWRNGGYGSFDYVLTPIE